MYFLNETSCSLILLHENQNYEHQKNLTVWVDAPAGRLWSQYQN